MNHILLVRLTLLFALISTLFCSSQKLLIQDDKTKPIFTEADKHFLNGEYEKAEKKYQEILKSTRQKSVNALAQYKLGYLYIYFNNPASNYAEALKHFKLFLTIDNKHPYAKRAKNWIKILTELTELQGHYATDKELLDRLKAKQSKADRLHVTLKDSLDNVMILKDTLQNRIKVLEENEKVLKGVIDKIEKIE